MAIPALPILHQPKECSVMTFCKLSEKINWKLNENHFFTGLLAPGRQMGDLPSDGLLQHEEIKSAKFKRNFYNI
jgi:hypothetical protein